MITVMDILSQPVFSQFKLASGRAGLHNVVSGTGIFEWESRKDMDSAFGEGEFIMTTLSQAKGDIGTADVCLTNLLDKNVSCICIKSVYFSQLSKKIQDLSESKNIPIFFFSNTFFDDIIFTVKTALLANLPGENFVESIQTLLKSNLNDDEICHISKKINPFFYDDILCAYATFRGSTLEAQEKKNTFYASYRLLENRIQSNPSRSVYSLIPLDEGILIIYTENTSMTDSVSLIELLQQLEITKARCHIGLSTCYFGLEKLSSAVKESFYANTSCMLDNEGILSFDQTGLDRILLPSGNNSYTLNYYKSLLKKIQEYDVKHHIGLMDTLLQYAACGNDIQLTAKKTFQHSNTIRYRLEKAKKTFSIEDNAEFHRQLYVFCRLHNIYQHFK